ncbi:unnamed protein product [Rotaria magnacalcarata]|uniref:E3 ubiquitin-protein ligase n=1 Tax=Rotaria magnacalcarata TaxID=392030 RepID=A0A816XDY1_9BILA|nr:unnamed protein product [Rotaria magnacalcarata]CAF1496864.1 unnamed protein product [Rotaria magnacalcarata]CAF2146030.1 unnamed protein product [Rotaria magnacalcarata]CAF2148260.1 unnamed protein product [Rotaria magnacalcarata]CAF3809648.1 unnamed protein product [Rotaria magnacalcarata]
MSDHRRSSTRKCVTRRQIPSNSLLSVSTQIQNDIKTTNQIRKRNPKKISDTTVLTTNHGSPNIDNSLITLQGRKRARLDSVPSRKLNQKKKREIVYDDDDDDDDEIEVISSKVEPIQITEADRCAICLDDCTEPKQLNKCSHIFCRTCIDRYFETIKPQCPCCFTIYGEIRGNQPINGTMTIDTTKHRLLGFEHDSRGTIRITYHFPHGIQDESHPNPGMPYYGTTRQAYLPDNREGRQVLALLQRAFELRQIFTVGQSRTTGYDNVITWNDIHHKTSINGGVENFGYPDKTYLNRVRQELAAKGVK